MGSKKIKILVVEDDLRTKARDYIHLNYLIFKSREVACLRRQA